MEDLTFVTKEVFEAYLLNVNFIKIENQFCMHSDSYYINDVLIAYKESSSYNNIIIYKVKNPLHRTNPNDTLFFK